MKFDTVINETKLVRIVKDGLQDVDVYVGNAMVAYFGGAEAKLFVYKRKLQDLGITLEVVE